MTQIIIKIALLVVIITAILAGFRYITPTGHLPDQLTGAVSYIKNTLDWVSYSLIDLGVLLTCFGIIIGLESALLFLKLILWIIDWVG